MHCHRYIQLSPLRAAMVANPHEYHRSPAIMHPAYGDDDPLAHPHPAYIEAQLERSLGLKKIGGPKKVEVGNATPQISPNSVLANLEKCRLCPLLFSCSSQEGS